MLYRGAGAADPPGQGVGERGVWGRGVWVRQRFQLERTALGQAVCPEGPSLRMPSWSM
jgi:hypothetical protein